jgi:phage shock protein PspC (stress-responsive transcriptional regulator)
MTAPVPRRSGVRRSRTGAVLGGVCAGVARSAGLDPLLLRVAVVAVTLLTGGAGLLAYLVAWVLIPREEPSAADVQALGAAAPPRIDVRAAWSAAGKDLRSLAGELRRPQSAAPVDPVAEGAPAAAGSPPLPGSPPAPGSSPAPGSPPAPVAGASDPGAAIGETPADPPPGAVPSPRSPLEAADEAATALGERLRAPEVQAEARRAAASVTQALAASVDEVGRRVRRDRTPPASEQDQAPDHG